MAIKVLVSEDSDEKIAIIKKELIELGVTENCIIVAKNAFETRLAI